jgi:hypothetical protein
MLQYWGTAPDYWAGVDPDVKRSCLRWQGVLSRRAVEVAEWLRRRWVNRRNGFVAYVRPDRRRKPDGTVIKSYTAHRPLDTNVLLRHVNPRHQGDLIALHAVGVGPGNAFLCRWGAIDVDNHDGRLTPQAVEAAAKAFYEGAKGLGLDAVLINSSKGSYHIVFFFVQPQPAAAVRRLGLWLTRDWAALGLPDRSEVFPKQDRLRVVGGVVVGFGSALRPPGLHHTDPLFYSRVWDDGAGRWLEHDAMVDALLAHEGGPLAEVPGGFAAEVRAADERETKARADRVQARIAERTRRLPDPTPAGYAAVVADALRSLGPKHYDDRRRWLLVGYCLVPLGNAGLEMWKAWSAQSAKFKEGECESIWPEAVARYDPADCLDPEVLLWWARREGWRPPDQGVDPAELQAECRRLLAAGGMAELLKADRLLAAVRRLGDTHRNYFLALVNDLKGDPKFVRGDFEQAVKAAEAPAQSAANTNPYQITRGGVDFVRPDGDVIRVCEWTGKIVEVSERVLPWGETKARYTVEATLPDGRARRVEVDADAFDGGAWVQPALGPDFLVWSGRGLRDHAATAVLAFTDFAAVRRTVTYTTVGFHERDGARVYVDAGGAVGPDGPVEGVRADIRGLEAYRLPPPPDDPRDAVAACLALLDLGRDGRPNSRAVAAVVASLPWRAVLGPFRSTPHFAGSPGAYKTATAYLGVNHFAPALDHRSEMIATWDGSRPGLEALQNLVGDSVLLIDELLDADVAKADAAFSAKGNMSARRRAHQDGSPAPPFLPRGTTISTGNASPGRGAARARALILEFSREEPGTPGTIDRDTLLRLHAGRAEFAAAMSAYVRHLLRADHLDRARAAFAASQAVWLGRVGGAAAGSHQRQQEAVADLRAAYGLFLDWAVEAGAVDRAAADAAAERVWAGLLELLPRQAAGQEAADHGLRFLVCLRAALNTGQAFVVDHRSGHAPDSHAGLLGWRPIEFVGRDGLDRRLQPWPNAPEIGRLDGDKLLFNREAAYLAAAKFAKDQARPLAGPEEIWQRLAELKLCTVQQRRSAVGWANFTVRRQFTDLTGRKRRLEFLEIPVDVFWPESEGDDLEADETEEWIY